MSLFCSKETYLVVHVSLYSHLSNQIDFQIRFFDVFYMTRMKQTIQYLGSNLLIEWRETDSREENFIFELGSQ